MKIVFMGTPKFSVRILENLNNKYEVALVVTQPDKMVGRKKEIVFSPVKQKAIELGLKVFQPTSIKSDYEEIINVKADILITAAYGQLIPVSLLNSFKYCINVHASLLPKYRGGAPIQRSIINGDEYSGVTIMQMVKRMDAGVIYAQEKLQILPEYNNEILFDKLSILGNELLDKSLLDILSGKNVGIPQEEALVTYAPNISSDEEKLSFGDTSINIFNKIRGLAMEPGAYASINNENIKIYSSKIVDYDGLELPGTILDLKKKILVKTKDGAIELLLIKPQGKNMMKSSDYVNGQKLFKIGDIFNN